MNPQNLYEKLKTNNTTNAKTLLNQGFDVNGLYFYTTGTFLYQAIQDSEAKVVHFLMQQGADPNVLYNGENALSFLNFQKKQDVDILRDLLEANVHILPIDATGRTAVEFFEQKEADIEEVLSSLDMDLAVAENSNNAQAEVYAIQENISFYTLSLNTTRDIIALLRPIMRKYVIKLNIRISGMNQAMSVLIDTRATVRTLKELLNKFYFDGVGQFDILYPAFHKKNKQVMEDDRALSDYGLQEESKVVLVMKVSSARHWEGGRKTRKTRKTRRQRKN